MCSSGAVGVAGIFGQMLGNEMDTIARIQELGHNADMAREAADQKEEQARIKEQEAELSRAQATDAERRGRIKEKRHRTSVRGLIGSQRAAYASSGVDVSSGIAYDVQFETGQIGEADAVTIRYNAAKETWKYNTDAWRHEKDAETLRWEAEQLRRMVKYYRKSQKTTRTAGSIRQFSTLLGGGSQAGMFN